jgi:hypothetical protein
MLDYLPLTQQQLQAFLAASFIFSGRALVAENKSVFSAAPTSRRK